MVCVRILGHYCGQLAKGPVLDKVVITAALQATFVLDGIDGTVGCGHGLQVRLTLPISCLGKFKYDLPTLFKFT